MTTQPLVVHASLYRQKIPRHFGGNTIGHKGTKIRPQFNKLGR